MHKALGSLSITGGKKKIIEAYQFFQYYLLRNIQQVLTYSTGTDIAHFRKTQSFWSAPHFLEQNPFHKGKHMKSYWFHYLIQVDVAPEFRLQNWFNE